MKPGMTRRDFMHTSALAVVGAAVGLSPSKAAGKKSRVVLVRHDKAVAEDFAFNQPVIQQMIDQAVMALLDEKDPKKAFKRLVKPSDVVGIKSNEWNYLPTPKELENALQRRVLDVGVKKEDVSIDDRGVRTNSVFKRATALINVRPLRTHHLSGMSGCMKNYIKFTKNPPDYHPNNCADLGLLLNLPETKGKSRLHVLSILTAQFHGRGPHHFNRRYVWAYKGLVVGRDPVAVDTVGLKILVAKRKQELKNKFRLAPMPRYIQLADTKHGLGTSDFSQIELIRLGWKEGILI